MAGIQRIRLNALSRNITNGLIIGIVIAKSSPRLIQVKTKDTKGVLSITLRDSAVDVINCDIWGSEYFVTTYYENFTIGDVVEIKSPSIMVKEGNRSEIFRPVVSSPFFLSVNEGQAEINLHTCDGAKFAEFQNLLHIPTKAATEYYGLRDALKIEPGTRTYVDLLVVVKSVGGVRHLKTKQGTDMTICTVEVIDNTTPSSVPLDIFDLHMIKMATEWQPLESVLFIADAKIAARGGSVQLVSKSVITHQPHISEAESLRLYARNRTNAPPPVIAPCGGAEAASVRQVKDRCKSPAPFTVNVIAFVTYLDIEKLPRAEELGIDCSFEVRIRFSDHSGELGARVEGHILSSALNVNSGELMQMSPDDRNTIRWRLLLERCCAQLSVCGTRISVIGLRRAGEHDTVPLY